MCACAIGSSNKKKILQQKKSCTYKKLQVKKKKKQFAKSEVSTYAIIRVFKIKNKEFFKNKKTCALCGPG
jgi:hypothetical protein